MPPLPPACSDPDAHLNFVSTHIAISSTAANGRFCANVVLSLNSRSIRVLSRSITREKPKLLLPQRRSFQRGSRLLREKLSYLIFLRKGETSDIPSNFHIIVHSFSNCSIFFGQVEKIGTQTHHWGGAQLPLYDCVRCFMELEIKSSIRKLLQASIWDP